MNNAKPTPCPSIAQEKHDLRQVMKNRRATLSPQQQTIQSRRICQRILDLPCCDAAENIVVYAPMKHEVQLADLIANLTEDVLLFAPCVRSKTTMELVQVTRTELFKNPNDQPEFLAHPNRIYTKEDERLIVQPEAIDLIIVPGLAFDLQGNRLGYGGGFYDRLFADLPSTARRIGVCFNEQLVECLPVDAHDQRMRAVVTAQETLLFDL